MFSGSPAEHDAHARDCARFAPTRIRVPEEGATLRFTKWKYCQRHPMVVVFDTETCQYSLDDVKRRHDVIAVGMCTLVHDVPAVQEEYKEFFGSNSVSEFLDALRALAETMALLLEEHKDLRATREEREYWMTASTHCHVCRKPFQDGETRALDHSHLSGRIRGYCHEHCNLSYQDARSIIVAVHNGAGFDFSPVILGLLARADGTLSVLPHSSEKYISFTYRFTDIKINLRFIDTYKFLSTSLDNLAKSLQPEDMIRLRQAFGDDEETFSLMRKKGITITVHVRARVW